MKNDFDKELDSLLRGHTATVRRDAASSPARQQPGDGGERASRDDRASSPVAQSPSHLDADELNAYAENALPARTRARYMAHLADCDSCRKIATDIALAAGVAGELEKRAAVPEHSAATIPTWRERLAALFAPRVLRYVAPALAVLFVGVVGFVALRQKPDLSPVAKQSETAGESPNVATNRPDLEDAKQPAPPSPSSSPAGTNSDSVASTKSPNTVAPGAVGSASGSAAQPDERSGLTLIAPEPPVEMAKKAGPPPATTPDDYAVNKSEELSSVNQQRDVTRSETQTTAAQNSVTINEDYSRGENSRAMQNNAEVNRADTGDYDSSRRGQQRSETQARSRSAPSADKSVEEAGVDASQAPPPKPSTARQNRELAGGGRKQSISKEKKDNREAEDERAAETRTVAGRRFRRQNGVWIDTAYSSSRALIDVRRGSEQFRALVADESGLRSIASQLGGEVIVVWKNRAYRIR